MLNNEHIFKFDDSRLFQLRKYTLGFHQTIVTFELHIDTYIVKKSSKNYVVGGITQKGIGRVFPISQFSPSWRLPSFAKTASFLLLVAWKFKVR